MSKNNKNTSFKNRIMIFIIAVLSIAVVFSAKYISEEYNKKLFSVWVDDQVIGTVEDKEGTERMIEELVESYRRHFDRDVMIVQEITIEETHKKEQEQKTIDQIKDEFTNNIDLNFEAYAINVDGEDLFYLDTKEYADEILSRLKKKYTDDFEDKGISKVDFVEKVEVVKRYVDLEEITELEDAYETISIGTMEIKKYQVQKGETASHIAYKFDVRLKDIEKANQDVELDLLQIGQVINLTVPKPLINVKIIEEVVYEEDIPYEVNFESTESLYKGEIKVKIPGIKGIKSVTAEVTSINGIEDCLEITNEEILEEQKAATILKGTKERPKTIAYGSFIDPTRGRGTITSRFGPRWGGTHSGIDIANPIGTLIKAADGGKVVFSGWKGVYGKLVIIDHENGYQTYYGHCSELLVKAGERVYRGQTIAKVGNTGRSTGPHVHFEVRKNGVRVDPLDYINR